MKRKAISKSTREEVHKKHKGHCAYCGCNLEYKNMQVDHLKAKRVGGKDEIENYMPACRMCNFYKDTLSIEEFRENIKTIPERLEREFIYRLAKKYGVVEEKEVDIKFYFEKASELGEQKIERGKNAIF